MHTQNSNFNINLVLHRFYRNINARSALSWRCSRTLRYSAMTASFVILLLTLAVMAPIYREVNTTEATTGTAQSSSLTLDVSNSTASVDLSVDNSNGTFVSSDSNSSISFNVSTNNYTGYKLSLSGTNDNQTLVNNVSSSDGTYASLSSIAGSVDEDSFSANTSTAGSNYNGKWGYNLTINSGTPSDYLAAPTTTSTPLDETSSANNTANNYKIGIGARAGYDTAAGTYTGTYVLNLVANSVAYVITYNDESGDSTVANLPDTQSATNFSSPSITLSSTIPTRTGYTFTGWCSVSPTNNSTTSPSCAGDTYTNGATYYFDYTIDNSLIPLYAMWKLNSYTVTVSFSNSTSVSFVATGYTTVTATPSSPEATLYYNVPYIITMSFASNYEFSSWTVGGTTTNATIGSTSTNGTSFIVTGSGVTLTATSKASAPGLCTDTATCMQEYTKATCQANASTSNVTLTDARDGNTYTVRYINGNCWMTQNLRIAGTISGDYSNFTAGSVNISAGSLTSGGSYTEARTATSGSNTWYNFCAASAGTICADSSSAATQDICPSGWKLPTRAETQTIGDGGSTYVSAFSPVAGGSYHNGSLGDTSGGYWWSSTNYGAGYNGYKYNLSYNGSSLVSGGYYDHRRGLYVRCVRSS